MGRAPAEQEASLSSVSAVRCGPAALAVCISIVPRGVRSRSRTSLPRPAPASHVSSVDGQLAPGDVGATASAGKGRAVLRAEAATMSRNGKLKSCLWNFLLSHKLAWVKGQMARCCCQTSGCFPRPRLRGPRLGRACWMASLCVLCSGRAWDAFEIRIFYSMIKF